MAKDKSLIRAPRRCVAKKTIKYKDDGESEEEEEEKQSVPKNVWQCVDYAFPGLTAENALQEVQGQVAFLMQNVIPDNPSAQTKLTSALKKITKAFEKKKKMVDFLVEFKTICGNLVRRCADNQGKREVLELMIPELPNRIDKVYKMTKKPVKSWASPKKLACIILEIHSVNTHAQSARKRSPDDSPTLVENEKHEVQSIDHSMMEDLLVDGTPNNTQKRNEEGENPIDNGEEMDTNIIAQPEIDMDYMSTEPAPKTQKMSTYSEDCCLDPSKKAVDGHKVLLDDDSSRDEQRESSFGIGQPIVLGIPSVEQFSTNSVQKELPSPTVVHESSNMQNQNLQVFPESSLAEVHLPLLQHESLGDHFDVEVQQMAPHHAGNGNNMEHGEEEEVEDGNLYNAGEVFLEVENGDGFVNDEELEDENDEELEDENDEELEDENDLEDESDEEMDLEMEDVFGLLALRDPQYLKRRN